MPANPMQRKVRNSFLIGMLVMLVVAILIGAIIYVTMVSPLLKEKEAEASIQYKLVYLINNINGIESGKTIQPTDVIVASLPSDKTPIDAITATQAELDGKIPIDVESSVLSNNGEGLTYACAARCDIAKGTILSLSVLKREDLDPTSRIIEYNMLTLPTMLEIEDYVDVRIAFPNGQDLLVVAHKSVEEINGANTISLFLTEAEILMMNSAIIENYVVKGSNMYVTKYRTNQAVDEIKNQITYVPTPEVKALVASNSNISKDAQKVIANGDSSIRNQIDTQIQQYEEERNINIESGIQAQISNARTTRQEALSEY